MLETSLQKDVIDAMREAGGAATKLSNRFLIGVSDLLIKLPSYDAMLVEVKKNQYPVVATVDSCVHMDVTQKQMQFLREYWSAGMTCGVLSFLYDRYKGKRMMHGAYLSLDREDVFGKDKRPDLPLRVELREYTELGRAKEFGPSVIELIRERLG